MGAQMMSPVAHSRSETAGIGKTLKGMIYFPMQWAAGLAALFVLEGGMPTANMITKVMAVRGSGLTARRPGRPKTINRAWAGK